MERLQLQFGTSILSYMRFGHGVKIAFCFHGYGEDAHSFAFLEKYGGSQYSFFAIDLPFHGDTEWNEGYNCTSDDIREIVWKILTENKLLFPELKLTLIGFSLGGRVALALYEKIAEQVGRMVLLAPDGLKVNFWYWLPTQTSIGNRLFSFTMKHPEWFFAFLRMLNKLKLVNASIFKFVNYYIGDKEVRRLLYARWTTLRKLKPSLTNVKSLININKSRVRLIYGKHDRIILSQVGDKFKRGIEENCVISVIPSGHQVLHERHADEIMSALLH